MGLLELENIVKRFPPGWCLDVDELNVEPGRIYAFYGPNGCGKTTLLNIMALLLRPDEGSVSLGGAAVDFSGRKLHRYRRNISLVMQKGFLFRGSVRSNITYGLKCRGELGDKTHPRIANYSRLLGLEDLLDRDVRTLSGGERQRVMLARSLVLGVDLLLLDEVMAGVDVDYKEIVESILRDYVSENGRAIVMTTHDLDQARRLADKVIYMDDGKITESYQ